MNTSVGILQILAFLLILAPTIVTIWASWKVVARAGYHGAWSLTLLIPLVNLVFLYVFAFSRWPVEGATNLADVFE